MNVCTSKSFFSYIIILLLTIIFKEKMVGCSCNKDFYQIYRDLANEGKGILDYLYKSRHKSRLPTLNELILQVEKKKIPNIADFYVRIYDSKMFYSYIKWSFEIMMYIKTTNGNKFCEEAVRCITKQEEKNVIVTAKNVTNVMSQCNRQVFLTQLLNTDESKSVEYQVLKDSINLFIRHISILQCNVEANKEGIYSFFIFTLDNGGYPMFILEPTPNPQMCLLTSEVLAEDNNNADESTVTQ